MKIFTNLITFRIAHVEVRIEDIMKVWCMWNRRPAAEAVLYVPQIQWRSQDLSQGGEPLSVIIGEENQKL